MKKRYRFVLLLFLCAALFLPGCGKKSGGGKVTEICNVSYDPTRELYAEYGRVFEKHW